MNDYDIKDDDSEDGSEGILALSAIDMKGVDFDADTDNLPRDDAGDIAVVLSDYSSISDQDGEMASLVDTMILQLKMGQYALILRESPISKDLFHVVTPINASIWETMQERVKKEVAGRFLEIQFLGVAALNLFLQCNYTGPALENDDLRGISPHKCFSPNSSKDLLVELAVDGEWPCPVAQVPYFLLVARCIFETLCSCSGDKVQQTETPFVWWWHARALVAHQRLLQQSRGVRSLWKEAQHAFEQVLLKLDKVGTKKQQLLAAATLEAGLAEHHFDRPKAAKKLFQRAQDVARLQVQVTGAAGVRTKFQKKASAQMLVKAVSANGTVTTPPTTENATDATDQSDIIKKQMIEHSEEGILLERIKFQDEKENEVTALTVLDQSIVLALCLDVKNQNPNDGLTAEEMGAFLATVLGHHDDWMVYSTALLERAWLEFERSHARERAILQMQALADQHTNRLTITQSTRESIEESAPVQDRLKNLHSIVYPPRWQMIQDLADRYASLGIVTSAAELYTEIELWDDVVDCYKRAGKVGKAEQIVRERLAVQETPRMWNALGDLTNDIEHYKKAIELSKGRFSRAYISLAAYYFDKGDLQHAAENYERAVKVRPLDPFAWFRLGTISMQLSRWSDALRAFSEVVQQEPEESEAWANVAAIHMHNKKPTEAYPALVESLKYNRNNWRVWISKLYTCLDLDKFDEAVQACNMILDFRAKRKDTDNIPPLEEKCVRAIVGGTLRLYQDSRHDKVALDSARRSLTRVDALLQRISSSSDAAPWVFEITGFFHEQIGRDEDVLDNLMKEYRALQGVQSWEKDNCQIQRMCQVITNIVGFYQRDGTREELVKARFLIRGTVKKIITARPDDKNLPAEVERLQHLLSDIESRLDSTI